MAARRRCLLLLVLLCCWSVLPARVSGDRYTAGTLRQYLREVITETVASHCAGGALPLPTRGCPSAPEQCASDYVSCGGVCYQKLETLMKHADAARACAAAGGRLAVPRSDHQQLCSRALALGARVWLGVTDPRGSGQWTGSDGAVIPRDAPYWYRGQPDNNTSENPDGERCVVLFPDQGWHDDTCHHLWRPLCQQR